MPFLLFAMQYSRKQKEGLREGGTRGTTYPGPAGTGARENESTHAQFLFEQGQNY